MCGDVVGGGAAADREGGGDLPIGAALRHEAEDRLLAGGQPEGINEAEEGRGAGGVGRAGDFEGERLLHGLVGRQPPAHGPRCRKCLAESGTETTDNLGCRDIPSDVDLLVVEPAGRCQQTHRLFGLTVVGCKRTKGLKCLGHPPDLADLERKPQSFLRERRCARRVTAFRRYSGHLLEDYAHLAPIAEVAEPRQRSLVMVQGVVEVTPVLGDSTEVQDVHPGFVLLADQLKGCERFDRQ